MPTRRPPDAAKLAAADTQPLQTKSEVKVQQMERQMDTLKPVVKLRGKLKETSKKRQLLTALTLLLFSYNALFHYSKAIRTFVFIIHICE